MSRKSPSSPVPSQSSPSDVIYVGEIKGGELTYLLQEAHELKPIPKGWLTFEDLMKALSASNSKTTEFIRNMRRLGRIRKQVWKVKGAGKIPVVRIAIYQILKSS